MNARTYAKVVGVVIVLIGIGGLALGEKSLLGVLNITRRRSPTSMNSALRLGRLWRCTTRI